MLEPLVIAGSLVIGLLLLVWNSFASSKYEGKMRARAESDRDRARERADALEKFQEAERDWRDMSHGDRVKRLLALAKRRRNS